MYAAAMVVIVFFCGMIAFQSGKRVLRNQLTQITVEAPDVYKRQEYQMFQYIGLFCEMSVSCHVDTS